VEEQETKVTEEKANGDVVAAPKRFRLPRPGRRSAIVTAIVAGLAVLGIAGAAWATFDYSNEYAGRILPGTRIAGVDVSGMSSEQALAAVEGAIQPQLTRSVEISHEDRTWRVTPQEIGARSNAENAVASALEASRETSFFKRMRMRLLGDELGFARDIAITYPRQGVRGFVKGIASGFERDARDASIDYSSGWVEIVSDRVGRDVIETKSQRLLMRALRRGSSDTRLAVKVTKPKVTADEFDQVLLLRIGENKLYLYEGGKITNSWTVATGQPEYPTPTGIYEVVEKRYMPTWVNPDPTGWGASMPASIPPGPSNPLGVRALNWSAEAIRFHGTSATYSLGYNASHGCVRLSNEEVVGLYDLVDVGTPIVSTVVAPLRPLYASAPDPIVVPEDSADTSSSDGGENDSGTQNDGKKDGN
jgi:hypothetical protein